MIYKNKLLLYFYVTQINFFQTNRNMTKERRKYEERRKCCTIRTHEAPAV